MSIAQVVVQSPEQVETSSIETSNVKSAATIHSESEDQDRVGLLAHWDDDGGTNRTS
jgi:predicted RNA-binding protein YlqC (UPF0109 family)